MGVQEGGRGKGDTDRQGHSLEERLLRADGKTRHHCGTQGRQGDLQDGLLCAYSLFKLSFKQNFNGAPFIGNKIVLLADVSFDELFAEDDHS